MRFICVILVTTSCLLWQSDSVNAASLRVAPTQVNLITPDSASVLSLTNNDRLPINVQLRVFRWTQINGFDRLEPTRDVVVSPPATKLEGGATTSIRIVRVSKSPVLGEESYRVIVDELPNKIRRNTGNIALRLRYSLPVFFAAPDTNVSKITWSVQRKGDTKHLVAYNSGERHVRISDLSIEDDSGRAVTLSAGLAGYLLGRSTMSWPLTGRARALSARSVKITAQSEAGQIKALAAP